MVQGEKILKSFGAGSEESSLERLRQVLIEVGNRNDSRVLGLLMLLKNLSKQTET